MSCFSAFVAFEATSVTLAIPLYRPISFHFDFGASLRRRQSRFLLDRDPLCSIHLLFCSTYEHPRPDLGGVTIFVLPVPHHRHSLRYDFGCAFQTASAHSRLHFASVLVSIHLNATCSPVSPPARNDLMCCMLSSPQIHPWATCSFPRDPIVSHLLVLSISRRLAWHAHSPGSPVPPPVSSRLSRHYQPLQCTEPLPLRDFMVTELFFQGLYEGQGHLLAFKSW